ncbi:MAG: hypothetical protein QG637_977 [Chloroflexota bacterium]|nr:hypothetical protein [Chloroflexota bacterium]
MSEHATIPVQGATQVIIDELARDAQVWGAADATEIQVAYQPAGAERAAIFSIEGDAIRLPRALVQRITLPAALAVTIKRAAGDLHIRGLTGAVSAEAVHGDLRLGGLGGTARIARVDGDLRADDVADLRLLGNCAGDLRFETSGNLEAETIAGDVRIADAGAIRLNRVHGDLWAERLDGALQAERINGDVRLNEIGGPVSVRALHGDLRAINLAGGLSAPQVQGDAILQGTVAPGANYALNAEGDISILLPAEADARLTLRAHGRIRSDVQLTPAADGAPAFSATIGQGRGRISLTSAGDIRIVQAGAPAGVNAAHAAADVRGPTPPEDLRTLGDRIRQQVTASLAAAGITVEGGGWGGRHPRGSRSGRPVPPGPPMPPAPPRPSAPPAPAEELRILKMVESGTITAEQAEVLLKALGG